MDEPKLISVKRQKALTATFPFYANSKIVVKFSAFGSTDEVTVGAATAKEYKDDFSPIVQATFQDARDGGPIIIADTVALWLPGDENSGFTPPDHARVALAEGKPLPRKVTVLPTALMKRLEFPLVKDVRAQGFRPDNQDQYLVSFRSSGNDETVIPVGRWLMRFEDGKHTPYVERIGFD